MDVTTNRKILGNCKLNLVLISTISCLFHNIYESTFFFFSKLFVKLRCLILTTSSQILHKSFCFSGCALSDRSPIVSWVRNTPPIRFDSKTSTTGFNIGGYSQIKYVFLEIRYHGPLSDYDYTNGFDVHITRTKYDSKKKCELQMIIRFYI